MLNSTCETMVTSTVSGALTKIILITVFFSPIAVAYAPAQSRTPRFTHYPASGIYAGPNGSARPQAG